MKKGFTLIELLAVIIILAVVALITVPTILDVVDSAKEKSRISSVNSLIDATRLYMSEAMLDDSIDLSENLLDIINNRVKGTKPDEGEIRIDGNDIGIAVKIDGYCYIKDYSEEEIRKTNDSECQIYKEVIAECYDGEVEVIDTIEINYDGCMANLNSITNKNYSTEELDSLCKNEKKLEGEDYSVYILDEIYHAYFDGMSVAEIEELGIVNIKYQKGCQTCFEYQKNIDFDINYDNCMVTFEGELDEALIDSLCKGETISANGDTGSIYDIVNLVGAGAITNFIEMDIIEKLKYGSEITITNYLCYEGNEKELPTITNLITPTSINGLKVNGIGMEAFAEKDLTSITISHGVISIDEGAFYNNPYKTVDIARTVKAIGENAFVKEEMIKDQTIINRTSKKFDWSDITGSEYIGQKFAIGTIYHQNGNIKVISNKNSNEKNEYLTDLTCYDGLAVIDNFEINYDGCVANLNSVFDKEYTTEEVEKICKNEEKISLDNLNFYLNDIFMLAYLNQGGLVYDISNIIDVTYACQTCFEYVKYIDFDINYDICMSEFTNDLGETEADKLCKGEKAYIDGSSLTLQDVFNLDNNIFLLLFYVGEGLMEDLRFADDKEVAITEYLCYEGNDKGLPTITDLNIPSVINDLKVSGIAGSAFYKKGLTSIKLPETLEVIENNAFGYNQISGELNLSNLTNLMYVSGFNDNQITSIKLPSSVTKIDSDAFKCNQISGELNLSNLTNLTEIGNLAFSSNQITSVKLPNSVTTIVSGAFGYNQISGELDLSNTSITTIDNVAFGSNPIASIKLPSSVTKIDSDAFESNRNLTLIEIDNIKDAISGSPWGASNATVKWLREE